MFKIIIGIIIVVIAIGYFKITTGNKKAAEENIKHGLTFLQDNSSVIGVKATDSGLQYMVLEEGTGTAHPTATSNVTVHYHGTLMDGRVFDSSIDRGQSISFGLNQVIKGWTEGLQLMTTGEKMRLFIPSDLAYGNRGTGMIPPGSLLIFDVELISIND